MARYAFTDALRVVNDTFVRSSRSGSRIQLSFTNPSVGDFVYSWLGGDEREATAAILGAYSYEQLRPLLVEVVQKFPPTAAARLLGDLCKQAVALWSSPEPRFAAPTYWKDRFKGVDALPSRRLVFLLELMDQSPACHDRLLEFTSDQASIWADSLQRPSFGSLNRQVTLAVQLKKFGLIQPAQVNSLHKRVQEAASDADDWRLLQDLHMTFEEYIDIEDQRSALDELGDWLERQIQAVSDDPTYGSHNLMEARDVADELGISYDDHELEAAISSLENSESEARSQEERDQEQEEEDDEESESERQDSEIRRLFSMLEEHD